MHGKCYFILNRIILFRIKNIKVLYLHRTRKEAIMNPFITKGYAGAEYFCDRVKETNDIVTLLTNGNNIAIMSPRRIGKTDLIRHCFAQPELKEHYNVFLIDIYATQDIRDFVNVFGKSILDALKPRGRKVWEAFIGALKSVQAQLSFDINNNPSWSLGLGDISNPSVTLDEIFSYLNSAPKPSIVALDEFQQITNYPNGSNIEAMLRTYIQRCNNATFIFSGSKRDLMTEIFSSPARPFYQSVMPLSLHKISEMKYENFACGLFAKNGKGIEPEVVADVYSRFEGVTSCLQRMMNVLFLRTPEGGIAKRSDVDAALDYILDLFEDNYQGLYDQIPSKQREVLVAIAKAGHAKGVTGRKFIQEYHLQTASAVTAAIRSLLGKDLITLEKGAYMVYDQFFGLWLKER